MYESHFGLKDKPFRLTPDARFFYPGEQHRRALAFLEYGLHEGEGFIVITGEPGTGKSTLVSKLLAEQSQNALKVATIETTRLSDEHLLEMLVSRFDLKAPRLGGKAGLIEALRNAFVSWEKRGTRALAIIDEAQNLPSETVEELRMLSNLTGNGRPLLQTFLIGQPALRTRIEEPEFEQLRQRITASFHLGPFKIEEVEPYIEHRLAQAGWEGGKIFGKGAYEAIFRATAGLPRLINMLCDRLLLFCYLEDAKQVDKETVTTVAEETGVRPPPTFDDLSDPPPEQEERPKQMRVSQGFEGLALVSELIERLRAVENRIEYSERRIRLELISLRKMLSRHEADTDQDR